MHRPLSGIFCHSQIYNPCISQEERFAKAALDALCRRLSPGAWLNPHKSMFGTGNYDVNVVMAAAQQAGHVVKWYDRRRGLPQLRLDLLLGLIVNVPPQGLGKLFGGHHWFAVRQVAPGGDNDNLADNDWYNLNSQFAKPLCIGSQDEVLLYLEKQLADPRVQLLLVVPQQHEEDVYKTESTVKAAEGKSNDKKPGS